jgi:hypothetical protein
MSYGMTHHPILLLYQGGGDEQNKEYTWQNEKCTSTWKCQETSKGKVILKA